MKKWFAFVLFAALVSCNNDDNHNNVNKRASRIYVDVGSGSEMVNLNYNSEGNISALDFNDYSLTFIYEGNRLSAIYDSYSNEAAYTFGYTNAVWTSSTQYGETVPVSFNNSTNSYLFYGTSLFLNGRSLSGAKASNGDVIFDASFDASRRGPLFSLPTESFFMMQAFSSTFFFLLERPATSMNIEGEEFDVANTFDSDGYLTEMVLTNNSNEQVNVRYIYE